MRLLSVPGSRARRRAWHGVAILLACAVVVAPSSAAFAASPPGVPGSVTAAAVSPSTIHVSWAAVSGATRYVVSNGEVSSADLTTTSYNWGGLSPGAYSCFTVTAKNAAGQSPWSAYACAVTQVTTPTSVTAVATNSTNIHVTWGSVAGATYVVSNGNTSSATLYTTSYDWGGLAPGTYMCFTVTAKEGYGQSPWPAYACTTTPAAGVDTYVNIGDSYSAGEGTYSYVAGTNTPTNMCHRSTSAYSGQYVSTSSRYHAVTNVACAGAVTGDITQAPGSQNSMQIPTAGELAQVVALSTNTHLVTLTIGGNNLNLAGIATQCYSSSILKSVIEACFVNAFNDTFINNIANLRSTLDDTYQAVIDAAPHATVAVLTYPQIFPKTYTGADCTAPGHVTILNAGISQAQLDLFRKVTTALDDVVRAAAHDKGLTILDEENAFVGHEACTSDPYVNGLIAFGDNESLHPDVAGYAREAADVKAYFDAIA